MMDTTMLFFCAFLAGFVDSVVGGGGLIQAPALFLFLPPELAANVAVVFGANKMSSICGTTVATWQYARRVAIPWRSILPAAAVAMVFSFLGARTVSALRADVLKPVIFFLLVAVAVYTAWRKDFGNLHAPRLGVGRERLCAMVTGMAIGFYDGFFGPGTGSFLIFIFIGVFGFDFLSASASAKALNLATNMAAVAWFAATDSIPYGYGIPMGLCNVLGALAGTRMAILKGNRWVRGFFLAVMAAMILRFGWEIWRPGG